MPRRARIMLDGVPVHITHRGNNRQACFHADNDRSFYLHHLRRLARKTANALHAYCLMGNHVHLLLTGRSGSLWEGRFRSCLVQAEDYLLACYRYVEANPVRAGLCAAPRDYEWSSYRSNADGVPDPVITPHEEFDRLGVSAGARRDPQRDPWQLRARHGALQARHGGAPGRARRSRQARALAGERAGWTAARSLARGRKRGLSLIVDGRRRTNVVCPRLGTASPAPPPSGESRPRAFCWK